MIALFKKLPGYLFIASLTFVILVGTFFYGVVANESNLPPLPQIQLAYDMVMEVVNPSDRILETTEVSPESSTKNSSLLPTAVQPGLVLVAGDIADRQTAVRIMDRQGRLVHEWRPAWLKVWPDGEGYFPKGWRPAKGMYLHGTDILPDGSIVANFEHLSTFRMDPCGEVMWKLENLGHHSVHYDTDSKTIWVTAENFIGSGKTGYPRHKAPLRSWTVQNISLDGEILRTIPVIDIFLKNGLEGLLYMSSLRNGAPIVSGDTLHLNDVDTFPASMGSDIFNTGDLLLSFRNINTIMVVDAKSLKVKFLSVGRFARQHDPDFIAGDRISIFDNRNFTLAPEAGPPTSRIVEIDARNGEVTTVLDGSAEERFFTDIMGVHQRLENGNILVLPSGEGRVLEFSPDGRLVWRYDNKVGKRNMRTYMAKVLPVNMDEAFFEQQTINCQKPVR